MHIHATIQSVIVIAIIACAALYASWKTYKALTAKGGTCSDCPLKDTCNKAKRRKSE